MPLILILLMGIKKDIQQNKFRNNYIKAMANLLFTNSWMLERIKIFFKTENVSLQQYNMLRILRGSSVPLSTLQIRERMMDKMSDAGRIVNRLIAKKLVKKKNSKKDKRLVEISILPQGLEVLKKLDSRNNEFDKIFKNLSKEEAGLLSDLLDKLRKQQ